MEVTERLIPAMVEAGADGLEIGVPFSDPLADGATIQSAGFHALEQGVTLLDCVDLVARLRPKLTDTPLLLMGYYNPILNIGVERFCQLAGKATVDGLIIPDLPSEEACPLADAGGRNGIHLIPLLAPTSTDERIVKVCSTASGFIYCVSVTGVTGSRADFSSGAADLVTRVRRHTDIPLVVGFGVTERAHLLEIGKVAEAAAVGTALVRTIQQSTPENVVDNTTALVSKLAGNTPVPAKGAA